MTKSEQHEEIGRMYEERDGVRRKLACLGNKSRRIEKILRSYADQMEQRRKQGGNVILDRDYPTREEIGEILDALSVEQKRLRELDGFFASLPGAGA